MCRNKRENTVVGRKKINYRPSEHGKTAMEVLHSILPLMDNITGFQRVRISIFEENCLATICYKNQVLKRSFLRKSAAGFRLELRVWANEDEPGSFHICSKLNPV